MAQHEFHLSDETATALLGQRLARCLPPGATLLLSGPVGAGKSHLARALIRALAGEGTEVPSPSFTLVQTYDGPGGAIWHADLYRLTQPSEAEEIGLVDAFGRVLALVEWPDRLGPLAPADAVRLDLSAWGEGRRAVVSGEAGLLACLA